MTSAKQSGVNSPSATQSSWINGLRIGLMSLFIGLACLAFSSYVVVRWIERQILDTDEWVALVSPLPKQEVVSTALGSYISEQVFSSVDVNDKIADALPPRAAFLAGPLTSQLQNLTTNTAQKAVASDGFQTVWEGANRIAMNRVLAKARDQTPPLQARVNEKYDINISEVAQQLRERLGTASAALPALQPANNKLIDISADIKARPHRLRQFIQSLDALYAVLPLAIATAFLGALAISRHRRHAVIIVAVVSIILLLVELIAIKWLHQETLDQVHNPDNLSAVGYIYETLTGGLKDMIYLVIGSLVLLIGVLLMAGPADWAVKIRSYVHMERVRNSQIMKKWREARQWLGRWKYYAWLAVVVIVMLILAAFTAVTSLVVINALLLTLGLFALTHIAATPPLPSSK